ncbi:alpha/beta hydrolase [Alkalihalobacillus sp. AL-G]|uniref:alpha/beta hydrolase n=1 Tax=Alkalihalobacillus sp. AL-G TaxID=2926399 RepID=UPI00272AF7DC|nr:alpha/beta hydrolase [Alkalihalobacillus sp. AL-G]WLD92833.1 alpha/beta hydrolase [Alkalihalobacillus sp. AL-G]
MDKITYAGLLNKTLELYEKNGSLKAYRYITENAEKVKGNQAQIYNFRYSLASASGLEQEALQILDEAVLENGFWYEYDYLIEDDDLKPLHKYDEFQKMIKLCKEREESAKSGTQPELKILKGSNDLDDQPLIIALHGNQENSEITEAHWNSIVSENNILALPQSSQIEFSDGYVWDDVEKGSNELKLHYERILEQNNVDPETVIVGGFSAGASVALHSILNDRLSAKGFIFVAPWLPEIDEWDGLLHKLSEAGIKGFILCGDKDEDCFEGSSKFAKLLEEKNIAHQFKVVRDLDHEYPENFNQIIKEAIEYIRES